MPKGSWAYIQFVERPPGGGGGRPTDPDWGVDEGGHPDQGLPGGGWGGPVDPGFGHGRPPRPDQGLPGGRPGRPDQGLPKPPQGVWPPPRPEHPIVPLPPEVELPPGTIWPSLPEGAEGKYLVLAWVSGDHEHSGWHYVVVDTTLKPDQGLPGEGEEEGETHPDQGLPQPPQAQPKVQTSPMARTNPPRPGQPPRR